MKNLVVLGLGQRGIIYSDFAKAYPEKFNLAAVIDTDPKKLELAERDYPAAARFDDYHKFLQAKIPADIVAVSTQDESHKEHAVALMAAGYDLLLEKPIANNLADCLAIYEASKKYKRKVIVCHVLRYSPFYSEVKRIIDAGKLGDVVTINASENVGYYHQAHSFVRGPWRNNEQSSPMILAKCCHDMDIIRYLMGEKCLSVNSYGDLYFFNEAHAPEGSAKYCSDCPVKNCVYKAQTLYTALNDQSRWFARYFTDKELTDENILADLRHSQYDRCVFRSDNDVVDHEVTIMKFANGKTACHTMTAFSKDIYRDIKIHGTKAELVGNMEENFIEVRTFGGDTERFVPDLSAVNVGGHMGGDYYMMTNVYKSLCGEKCEGITYLDVSIESHVMSFLAEESRLHDGETEKLSDHGL